MPRKLTAKTKRPRKGFDLLYGLDWVSDQTPIPRHLTFNTMPLSVKTVIKYNIGQNES